MNTDSKLKTGVALRLRLCAVCLMLAATSLQAAEEKATLENTVPSAESIRQVFNYYHQGTKALLTESVICERIGDMPPKRFECINSIDPSQPLLRYSEGYFWVSLMVPVGYSGKLEYRFLHEEKPVNISSVSISPSLRYRVWKFLPTHKAGKWKVELTQTMNGGDKQKIIEVHYTVE